MFVYCAESTCTIMEKEDASRCFVPSDPHGPGRLPVSQSPAVQETVPKNKNSWRRRRSWAHRCDMSVGNEPGHVSFRPGMVRSSDTASDLVSLGRCGRNGPLPSSFEVGLGPWVYTFRRNSNFLMTIELLRTARIGSCAIPCTAHFSFACSRRASHLQTPSLSRRASL
jgi:hypothetical protein